MKHNNIAIFIPHIGCKNCCSFCNQHFISGAEAAPTAGQVRKTLEMAFDEIKDKSNTEIAFFGGSFTAIDRAYMIELLETANEFVSEKGFSGIRISTRPDCIDNEVIDILSDYSVTSVELGAQSMCDDVLEANNRNHSADDVRNASEIIKKAGLSLGLQMMTALYKSDDSKDEYTARELLKLCPDTVRIYPTVVLKGTELERLMNEGKYPLPSIESAVSLCAKLLFMFESNGVRVIKLGLHSSSEVEKNMVGGIYHNAFRELCESEIYLKNAIAALEKSGFKNAEIFVAPKTISKMIGQNKKNMEKLEKLRYNIKVSEKEGLEKYEVLVKEAVACY